VSDCHVFGHLKEALGGKKFCTDDEVKGAVYNWLCSQSEDFFSLWNPGSSEMVEHLH
jgi:hypothetical protein